MFSWRPDRSFGLSHIGPSYFGISSQIHFRQPTDLDDGFGGLLSAGTFNEEHPEKTTGRNAGLLGLWGEVVQSREGDQRMVLTPSPFLPATFAPLLVAQKW